MRGKGLLILAVLAWLVLPALAQRHADLTPAEIDQLRDTAMEPDQRLKLFVKFGRERLDQLQLVRSDPKISAANRPAETHKRLQDFLDVYDELDDNIDTYMDRKSDIRKALKAIIEADTEFQSKLKTFREGLAAAKEDTKSYEFLLSNAIDAVNSGATDHRKLLDEQEEMAKHKKKKKTD
jgi:regulator of replication initiation timing